MSGVKENVRKNKRGSKQVEQATDLKMLEEAFEIVNQIGKIFDSIESVLHAKPQLEPDYSKYKNWGKGAKKMPPKKMKVSEEVLKILDEQTSIEGNVLKLVGQLERNVYVEVNKVLEAMGGKWNRGLKGHVFEDNPSELMDCMFESGEVVNKKKELGFFETPRELTERMIDIAGLKKGMTVLEPSAGRGAIAEVVSEIIDKENIRCVEYDDNNIKAMREKGFEVQEGDFLAVHIGSKFDRVIMNPPFGRRADILHVRKAYEYLKDGGVLVSVMASGVTFRSDKKTTEFKEFVEKHGRFEDIPSGTFKESGTMVNTILCILTK